MNRAMRRTNGRKIVANLNHGPNRQTVEGLMPGIYLLQVEVGGKMQSLRFAVVH